MALSLSSVRAEHEGVMWVHSSVRGNMGNSLSRVGTMGSFSLGRLTCDGILLSRICWQLGSTSFWWTCLSHMARTWGPSPCSIGYGISIGVLLSFGYGGTMVNKRNNIIQWLCGLPSHSCMVVGVRWTFLVLRIPFPLGRCVTSLSVGGYPVSDGGLLSRLWRGKRHPASNSTDDCLNDLPSEHIYIYTNLYKAGPFLTFRQGQVKQAQVR